MLRSCQCSGFDRKVLEAQEQEERERQQKKDRKRDRQVSIYLPDCWQNDFAHTAHSGRKSGLNNAVVLPTFCSSCAPPESFLQTSCLVAMGTTFVVITCMLLFSQSGTFLAGVGQLCIIVVQIVT